jgi:hypothetical protein
MEVVYNAVLQQLKDNTSLQWIDLDTGQLDAGVRPPVAYPAALIDIQIPGTEDISTYTQSCLCRITVRVACDVYGKTNADAPEVPRANALSYFNTVNEVYKALQGFSTAELDCLTRKSLKTEKRGDGLKVCTMEFQASFEDTGAEINPDGWS